VARAIVGAVTAATAIITGRIVGSATATAVSGLVIGTALAAGGAVIRAATLADVTGRIIATAALTDMTGGIVGTAALAGLSGRNSKRCGQGGTDQRKAGNLRHDMSPIKTVSPVGRTEGKRHPIQLIPAELKKVASSSKAAE
jgi:hypothetical protein